MDCEAAYTLWILLYSTALMVFTLLAIATFGMGVTVAIDTKRCGTSIKRGVMGTLSCFAAALFFSALMVASVQQINTAGRCPTSTEVPENECD